MTVFRSSLLWLCLPLLALPGGASAWTLDRASAGHDGWYRRGRWMPVEIHCTNGPSPFSGTLAVEVDGAIRYGTAVSVSASSRVDHTFWITVHSSHPTLSLVAIHDAGEERLPIDVPLREALGPIVACLPGALGDLSREDWLAEVPRPQDIPIHAIDWDFLDWRRDPHALECLDVLLLPPEEPGRRTIPSDLAPVIEAWAGLGGRLETDGRFLDLRSWRSPAMDPGIAPSAVFCLASESWPTEWRERGMRAIGILVLVTGMAAFLLRWRRASFLTSVLGMLIGGIAAGWIAMWIIPPSRATFDAMAIARIGSGARLQGMRLAGPVERSEWMRIAGVPAGTTGPSLSEAGALRRLWPDPESTGRGPAGLLCEDASVWRWRPPASGPERAATFEATTLGWEALPLTVSRQPGSVTPVRWLCSVQDSALEDGERYLTDGQTLWSRTGDRGAEVSFEWPAPDSGVALWKFAERAQAHEDDESGCRLRMVAAVVGRLPPGRRYLLAFAKGEPLEQPRAGFLHARAHPTLWVVECPEK